MAPSQITKQETSDEGSFELLEKHQDILDQATFEQILEMDDDGDDREFSREIVYGFFEQAESTFENMEYALESKDFDSLSQLGHFLKGSSATLGLTKVKDACEKIQHCKEELPEGEKDSEREKAIKGIKKTLEEVQVDYKEVADLLRRFFGEKVAEVAEEEETETTAEAENGKAEKA